MAEKLKRHVCQECGYVQEGPAPCLSCAGHSVVPIEGPNRLKALMPPARPL